MIASICLRVWFIACETVKQKVLRVAMFGREHHSVTVELG